MDQRDVNDSGEALGKKEPVTFLQMLSPAAWPSPVFLHAFLLVVIILLLVFVTPVFKEMFEGMGGKLPGPTIILFGISDMIRHHIILFIPLAYLALCVDAYVFAQFKEQGDGRATLIGSLVVGGGLVLLLIVILGAMFLPIIKMHEISG